jgi:hypothetical protein
VRSAITATRRRANSRASPCRAIHISTMSKPG